MQTNENEATQSLDNVVLKRSFEFSSNCLRGVLKQKNQYFINTGAYKKHLGKIGDFDGGPYKKHFQNWQFDVSLLENFRKKVYLFHHFFKIFFQIHL